MPEVKVNSADLIATRVVNLVEAAPARKAKAGTKRADFFKRTYAEKEAGLTIEQARAARGVSATPKEKPSTVVEAKPVQAPKSDSNKTKRLRRTKEEMDLGLTIEQAAERRAAAVQTPSAPKRYELRPQPVQKPAGDLIETLSPRIQLRARAVSSYRAKGHQGAITAEMLDLVERAVKDGKVTKCEPFLGSDGFNHFTQQETK